MHVLWMNERQASSLKATCQPRAQRSSRCCELLFHVTLVPTSSRFRQVFHDSLLGLHGHLSKELTRAFPYFFMRKVLFVGRQVPLVAEWIGE